MSIQEWDITQTNLKRLKARKYEVAVLPTSAIEAHGWHLPEGEDFLHSRHIARRICEMAWPNCESVLCLPGLPYGVDCNLMDYPVSIHVSQDTLNQMIREIIISLKHFGIRKIVLLNGHGGNDFKAFVRQVQCDLDVHVFVCNWFQVAKDKYDEIFEEQDDHAGEMETSVALALFPELVEMEQAGDGVTLPYRFKALREGWVSSSRNFGVISDHCAVGNPAKASAEKGQRYLDITCERLAAFLVELANTPIDEAFPHQPH